MARILDRESSSGELECIILVGVGPERYAFFASFESGNERPLLRFLTCGGYLSLNIAATLAI